MQSDLQPESLHLRFPPLVQRDSEGSGPSGDRETEAKPKKNKHLN